MITQYHRPSTLDEAIELLQSPGAIPLGGGTVVATDSRESAETVIDLQAIEIAGIALDGPSVCIGAMARLQDLVDSPLVPLTLRELAHREAPNTIRNAATVGGTVGAADPESELITGFLAFGASVAVAGPGGSRNHSLDSLIDDPDLLEGAVITAVSVPAGGFAAVDRTARTPKDRPIVSVVARRDDDGAIVVAASGVADRPVLVDLESLDTLDPPADFRGSSQYRKHLAAVLTQRVVADVQEGRSA